MWVWWESEFNCTLNKSMVMSHKDSTRYLLKMENQYQAQDIKERCIMRNADPLARTQPHILPSSISVYIYIAFDMLSKSYSDISMCMCEMCLVYWGWTIKLSTHTNTQFKYEYKYQQTLTRVHIRPIILCELDDKNEPSAFGSLVLGYKREK